MTDTFISIDGGKSALRLLAVTGDRRRTGIGPGMSYRPGEDGVERTADAVRAAAAGVDLPERVAGVIAGLTAVPGDAGPRRELARRLGELFGGPALVAEDVHLAHAGALAGPGTVLCIGTGTNVLTMGAGGTYRTVEGWGPALGDRGSGYAIGLAGLRAATAALDGVGPPTALTEPFPDAVGGAGLAALQRFYRDPELVARIAGFAPVVVEAAEHDAVALAICRTAVDDLVALAASVAGRQPDAGPRVSWSGRLLDAGEPLRRRLGDGLRERGLELVAPAGSSLDGGLRLLRGEAPYAGVLERLREHGYPGRTGDDG
ncbi:N-acetylglucosamine kinase [Jiangella endophytica]|uniref:N-acetylglucosamine kinase n=1 Tax=Jiangella endophytica TaxID=1623398 RepID=UPI000E35749D|nr:BadF/BadG/BcrA/BcrD ATPase family protein [Jiangella endophytica]